MQLVKALLIIGAIVIAGGLGFLGNEVYHRANGSAPLMLSASHWPLTASSPSQESYANQQVTTQLTLPEGATLSALSAANDRVVFEATLPGGAYRLYVLDPKRAAITGIITLDSTIRKEPSDTSPPPAPPAP